MTTANTYSDVPQIFLTACKLPTHERSAYLDTACASHVVRTRVEAMLEADAAAHTVLDGSALDILPALADDTTVIEEPEVPHSIGPYRIADRLAQGGMGTVYLGLHPKTDRIVAIKVIRAGLATEKMLHRFAYEARLLARLHHPGIAQIFEAATHDAGAGPQPYLAIEFVEGPSLTDYAREHKLRTKARLALMLKLCDAVQHAHQQGVIHRDLKPNNIVVGENAQPKILDFGVARDIDAADVGAQTLVDVQQVAGTLPFMAPEQITGGGDEVDTRCDVYALGVIGYQLLSGRLPYGLNKVSLAEAARIIRDEEPAKLGKLRLRYVGDLENIFAKALSKDKEERYPTAQSLGNDIRRHLADEPIAARRPPPLIRTKKFMRRHKALVSGVAASLVVLAIGAASTVLGMMKTDRRYQRSLDLTYNASFAKARADALFVEVEDRLAALKVSGQELEDKRVELDEMRDVVEREHANGLALQKEARELKAKILREQEENSRRQEAAFGAQAESAAASAYLVDAIQLAPETISSLEDLVHATDELGTYARARAFYAVGRAYVNVQNVAGADRVFSDAMAILDRAYVDYLLRTSQVAAKMGHDNLGGDARDEIVLNLHASLQLSQAEHFFTTGRPREALAAAEGAADKFRQAYSTADAPVTDAVLTALLAHLDLEEFEQARELREAEFGPAPRRSMAIASPEDNTPVADLASNNEDVENAEDIENVDEAQPAASDVAASDAPELDVAEPDVLDQITSELTPVQRAKLHLADATLARADKRIDDLQWHHDEFAALRSELSEHRSLLSRHDVLDTFLTHAQGDNHGYANAVRVLYDTAVHETGLTSSESLGIGIELVEALRVAGRLDDAIAMLDDIFTEVHKAQQSTPLPYIDGAWIAARHVESAELLLERRKVEDIAEASMITGLALAELTALDESHPIVEARTNMLRGLALAAEGYPAMAPSHLEAALDNALTQPRDLERRRLALESLYDIHHANKRWDEARRTAAVLHDVVALQNEELRRASAKIKLADALRELQRFDEERQALVEAEQLRLEAYGSAEHPEVVEITQRLTEPDAAAVSQGSG